MVPLLWSGPRSESNQGEEGKEDGESKRAFCYSQLQPAQDGLCTGPCMHSKSVVLCDSFSCEQMREYEASYRHKGRVAKYRCEHPLAVTPDQQ